MKPQMSSYVSPKARPVEVKKQVTYASQVTQDDQVGLPHPIGSEKVAGR